MIFFYNQGYVTIHYKKNTPLLCQKISRYRNSDMRTSSIEEKSTKNHRNHAHHTQSSHRYRIRCPIDREYPYRDSMNWYQLGASSIPVDRYSCCDSTMSYQYPHRRDRWSMTSSRDSHGFDHACISGRRASECDDDIDPSRSLCELRYWAMSWQDQYPLSHRTQSERVNITPCK